MAIDSDGKLLPIAKVQLIEHEMSMRLLDPNFDQMHKDSFFIRLNRRWEDASSEWKSIAPDGKLVYVSTAVPPIYDHEYNHITLGTTVAGFDETSVFTDPTADWDFEMTTVDEQAQMVKTHKRRRRPARRGRHTQSVVP